MPSFFSVALRPNAGHGLLILDVSRSHTTTHHSRYDSSGRAISSSQRPLPDKTQHSQQTNIHVPHGIRTRDLSRRAAADVCLRPRGRWEYMKFAKYTLVCWPHDSGFDLANLETTVPSHAVRVRFVLFSQ
jgi:hypothetical protein